MSDVAGGTGPAVSASGLELRFGPRVALSPSDFVIPAEGVTAIIGPNGSGKSTVLGAIAGLHRPTNGEIRVLGTTPAAAQRRVAYVPQSTKVNDALPVTVQEVVAMGRYASLGLVGRKRAQDARMIDEAIDRLELRDLVGRHLRELSGGQRQRVFVAQGLVQERSLLLLDEPASALDLVSLAIIEQAIEAERAEGRPVVITTHDLAEARRSDHVILLASRVVAHGAPSSVLTSEHLSDAYQHNVGEIAGLPHIDDAAHDPAGARHVHVDPHRYHDHRSTPE